MMKHRLLTLTLLAASAMPAFAQAAGAEKPSRNPASIQFIRVVRGDENVRLQTGITTYTKDGVHVDLIGAIHIADADYYARLNKEFTRYEALLFEMVTDDKPKPGSAEDAKKEAKDPLVDMLGNVYSMVGKLLMLQGQKDGIDYTAKNFIHADLTLAEFKKLQQEKGESLLGFAMQNSANAKKSGNQPNMQKLLNAFLRGNSDGMKLELVNTIGGSGDQVAGMLGQSVIITDRNQACLKVLAEQIKAGKKKLGIFYGAAHFPSMEKELLKMGYQKTAHRWLTAWDIPKPKTKKKPAPARVPRAA